MHRILIAAVLMLALTALSCGAGGSKPTEVPQGTLQGIVEFIGVGCPQGQPGNTTPPCSGPYPDYSTEVREAGGEESVIAMLTTNGDGFYRLNLPVGEYVIYTRNGQDESSVQANRTVITEGEVTELNLQVDTGAGEERPGTVTGTVRFIGTPCPQDSPSNTVPPCDGPYPNYSVEILYAKTGNPAVVVRTNADGEFSTILPPGQYVIQTQNGISEGMVEETAFEVKEGRVTELELVVDTGIR